MEIRFNVSKSTVFHCLHKIVTVILSDLCKTYIKWSSLHERPLVADGFSKYGPENVLGIIDGCHMPIKKPRKYAMDYFNRKKFYSVVLQGVCKHELTFTDVDVRWSGGVMMPAFLGLLEFFYLFCSSASC
ncbi:hypothetical protein NQ314_017066 [Rhamnusium bicolor]|uniref:DDE Tnp4 domain-containing protein n=1 Tax=Rhamnusium bicolor TaxID=1586634 RepID=A0AAV8WVP3_9CUCU|nr:hypothetical protein NQ314_017066 [Rhamnusium bicolor]